MKISEEVKRAYRSAQDIGPAVHRRILADALRDAVAENMRLEHESECHKCLTGDNWYRCDAPDEWQAAAHKKLMGEE